MGEPAPSDDITPDQRAFVEQYCQGEAPAEPDEEELALRAQKTKESPDTPDEEDDFSKLLKLHKELKQVTPEIEWWDMPFIDGSTYENGKILYEKITDEVFKPKKPEKQDVEFIEEVGLHFVHSLGMFYDKETGLYFQRETRRLFKWNWHTSEWEDVTYSCSQLLGAGDFSQFGETPNDGHVTSNVNIVVYKDGVATDEVYHVGKDYQQSEKKAAEQKAKKGHLFYGSSTSNQNKSQTSDATERSSITIGRSKKADIRIPHVCVSTKHARIIWETMYFQNYLTLVDLGSQNGTFVNGTRVTLPRVKSKTPHILRNHDLIQFGSSNLQVKIQFDIPEEEASTHQQHALQEDEPTSLVPDNQNVSAWSLNKRLKRVLGLGAIKSSEEEQDKKYTDRAAERRKLYPNYMPEEYKRRKLNNGNAQKVVKEEPVQYNVYYNFRKHDTVPSKEFSSVHTPIQKNNVGFKLLSKMGWERGQGIGSKNQGRSDPLTVLPNHKKQGLGYK